GHWPGGTRPALTAGWSRSTWTPRSRSRTRRKSALPERGRARSAFTPLAAFADHEAAGNGEPLAILLRHGGAGSNTAADHVEATRLALAQPPRHLRRRVLVRTDSGGGNRAFLE